MTLVALDPRWEDEKEQRRRIQDRIEEEVSHLREEHIRQKMKRLAWKDRKTHPHKNTCPQTNADRQIDSNNNKHNTTNTTTRHLVKDCRR